MWYLQFFFYAWGHARIPAQYDYISWMLHMSFYVLCGGIVGLVLKEWNNAGRRPVTVLMTPLAGRHPGFPGKHHRKIVTIFKATFGRNITD